MQNLSCYQIVNLIITKKPLLKLVYLLTVLIIQNNKKNVLTKICRFTSRHMIRLGLPSILAELWFLPRWNIKTYMYIIIHTEVQNISSRIYFSQNKQSFLDFLNSCVYIS